MVDQRKDKRAPASLKVKYKSATVDEFMGQFGTDVSTGGIFVKTKKPIEIGALLKLELQLADASPVIHGIGRVCWRRELAPDPNLPAGMGIKFIKLDPDSRAVVERIVQGRGSRPSRFDQTQGAEIAGASEPPPSELPSASSQPAPSPSPPPPSRAAAPAPRAAAPTAPARVDAPRPAVPATKPAAPRQAASAAKMAGLFADSPLAKGSAPVPRPEVGTRSSFFPPAAAPTARAGGLPPPAVGGSGPLGAAKLAPPPPAIGSVPPPRPTSSVPPAARASQARHSGQFLAAAFAEGGVAEATATQARVAADTEANEIDELFAGVVDEPARQSAPAAQAAAKANVEDVFAELSEEEGLSEPPVKRPTPVPARGSSPGAAPRASSPGRASAPDGANQLLAELEDDAPTTEMPGLEDRATDEASTDADLAGTDDEFGEADLFAASSPPRNSTSTPAPRSVPPQMSAALQELVTPPARPASPLPWILLVLAVLGGGGGFLYYQHYLAPQADQVQVQALPPAEPAEPAAATAATEEAPTEAPTAPAPTEAAPAAAPSAAQPAPAAPAAAAKPTPVQTVEIEVSSLPRDSDITVDGKPVGKTPKHVALPIGIEAKVTVSTAGYASMTKAVVASPSTEPLRFKLEPLPYSLIVRSVPPEADLAVGQVTAIAPAPLALGHLEGGVQVSISKDGYQRMTRLVRIDEFAEKDGVMRAEVDVTLSPLPGGAGAAARARAKRPHAAQSSEGSGPPAPSLPPPAPPDSPAPSEAPSKPAAAAAPSEPAPAAPSTTKPAPDEPPPRPKEHLVL
jgi:uncharacterized protein (TIGR02266 family)